MALAKVIVTAFRTRSFHRALPRKFSACLLTTLICVLVSAACNHQTATAKPRPEPSAGAGLSKPLGREDAGKPATEPTPKAFLLQAELGPVRQALETQDYDAGYSALSALVGAGRAYPENCDECRYLLGVLAERAGDATRSSAAFEAVANHDWALREDAMLHLVPLEIERHRCARADEWLKQLTSSMASRNPLEQAELTQLAIEADGCANRLDSAISRLREWIDTAPDQCRKAESQWQLGRLLLERATSVEQDLEGARQEAIALAKEARTSCAVDPLAPNGNQWFSELLESTRKSQNRDLVGERVYVLESYVEARRWDDAKRLAKDLLTDIAGDPSLHGLRCRVVFAEARAASGTSERKLASDRFAWVSDHCDDADLAARALFLEAGQLAALGQSTQSIAAYAELERRFERHRLADDARLKRANLYRALGSDSHFVALLDAMPNDYPDGDMLLEGLFQLALRSMVQRDWSTAHATLERATRQVTRQPKNIELDRQKYFLAKAKLQLGRTDSALPLLRELITERPLGYYMLLAYSEISRTQPALTTEIASAIAQVNPSEDSSTTRLDDGESSRVIRVMRLLGVGDVRRAQVRLRALGETRRYLPFVTAIADMFVQVGAPKTGLSLVTSTGFDWRLKWPTSGWMEFWHQAYPRPYRQLVQKASRATGIDESLIYAIMREESEFDPSVISRADAIGLMQLIVPTARIAARDLGMRVDERALQRPATNIAIGARVLAKLSQRFQKQTALVAAGYNAGPGRPLRWLRNEPDLDLDLWVEQIEFPETRAYVKRVIESEAIYHWLYATSGSDPKIRMLPKRFALVSNQAPAP
ncbi:MAG TPA: transglycosylase SLT domain-containing protein [Polyangiaceae bacterium]